jgi:hypothetical protein
VQVARDGLQLFALGCADAASQEVGGLGPNLCIVGCRCDIMPWWQQVGVLALWACKCVRVRVRVCVCVCARACVRACGAV